jgi:diguanylate cyclase (GGDEF)-like protein
VALLDLDRFKAVNDTFGHPTGDEVLRQIAARLAGLAPPVRLAARLHGDEFLLVIDGDAAAAQTAARTAWRAIAGTPLVVAGHLLRVTASVGVAATAAGTLHDELLVHADQAMYHAKSAGTGVHLHMPQQQPPPTGDRPRRRYRDRPTTGPSERTPTVATDLYFDLARALRLAEHAVAAPIHEPSYTEHEEGVTCPGALVWVADDGTYLMSGGRPPLLADPDNPTSNVVVHAHGFGPGGDRHLLGGTDVGFDDFAEHLHLTDGDPPLIDLLRAAAARGYRWLMLRVDGDTVTTRVSRTGPPEHQT